MSQKISKITGMTHGHALIDFEDGARIILNRGEWESLKVGDVYPPVPVAAVAVPEVPPTDPGDPTVPDPAPSAADLDAVAAEQKAAEATGGSPEVQEFIEQLKEEQN